MLRRNHQIPLAAARSRRRTKLLRIVRPSRPQREILESHRDAAIIPLINDTLRFGWVARRRHRLSASSRRTRLCEKSVVQSACRTSVSVSSIRKSIALATSVRRRQLRKQFCASLAHATFHTAWNAGTHTPCRLVLVVPLDPFVETSASGVMGPGIRRDDDRFRSFRFKSPARGRRSRRWC